MPDMSEGGPVEVPVISRMDAAVENTAERYAAANPLSLAAFEAAASRGMIALSLAITDEDCDAFVVAFDGFLERHEETLAEACD